MTKEDFNKLPVRIKTCVAIRKWNLSTVLATGRIEITPGEALQLHNGYLLFRNNQQVKLFLN